MPSGAADTKQSFPISKAIAKTRDAGSPIFASSTGPADRRRDSKGFLTFRLWEGASNILFSKESCSMRTQRVEERAGARSKVFFFFFAIDLQACHTLSLSHFFFFSVKNLLFGSHLLNLSAPPFPWL